MPQAPALLAQTQSSPDAAAHTPAEQARAARELTALLTGLSILLLVFLLVAILIFLRRRAGGPLRKLRRRTPPGPSAWTEAGRRVPPEPGAGDNDETIDYDPRDLSPDDINPDTGPTQG